ncbi:MAG: NAD(P)H-hydrate epimerase [Elusimicrobiota bacterium]|jgi:NAD(P)H-hydrate epimerase|nr:NAD(P)H-hydrate epimerase [Elusimicrobiota bacterium]
MKTVSVKQMKAYEEGLFARGLSPDLLMENAGRLCAQQIIDTYFPNGTDEQITIICGSGGNGGDGLVLARCLMENKIPAVCYIVPSPKYGELTKKNIKRAFVCHTSVKEIDKAEILKKAVGKSLIVVDALLGLGASKEHTPRPVFQEAIDIINTAKNIISIDGPSGLDMDDGSHYLARPVKAKETYTLGFAKNGLVLPQSAQYIGKLIALDIFSQITSHCK